MAAPQAYPHMEELIASMIELTNLLLCSPPSDVQRLAMNLHMSAFALRDLWHTSRQMAELQGAIQVLQATQIVAVMRNEPALSAATDLLVGMNTVGGTGGNSGPMGGMGGFGQTAMGPVAAGSIMLPPPIPAPFITGHPAGAYPPLGAPPPPPPSSNQTPQPRRRSKKRRRPLSMVSTAEPTSPQAVVSPPKAIVPPSAPKALLLASKATPAASKRSSFQAGHSRAASKAEGDKWTGKMESRSSVFVMHIRPPPVGRWNRV